MSNDQTLLTIETIQGFLDNKQMPATVVWRMAEQLLATMQREAKLRLQMREGAECLHDVGSGKGGWAWEEVYCDMIECLEAPSEYSGVDTE